MMSSIPPVTPRHVSLRRNHSIWIKITLTLFVVRLVQWLVPTVSSTSRAWLSLPNISFQHNMMAGAWLISSMVFLYFRTWYGLVSAMVYLGVILVSTVVRLSNGVALTWGAITLLIIVPLLASLVASVLSKDFVGSRL